MQETTSVWWNRLATPAARRRAGPLSVVGAPLPYLSPALGVGGWVLLAYPKLYGGLLLWAGAIGISRTEGYERGLM